MVRLLVGDTNHEKVAYILQVRIISVPEAPEYIGKSTKLWEIIWVGVFTATKPDGASGRFRRLEIESIDSYAIVSKDIELEKEGAISTSSFHVDSEFIVCFGRLYVVSPPVSQALLWILSLPDTPCRRPCTTD